MHKRLELLDVLFQGQAGCERRNIEKKAYLTSVINIWADLTHRDAGKLPGGTHEDWDPMLIYVCCDLLSKNKY